jgi:hypothetical protein
MPNLAAADIDRRIKIIDGEKNDYARERVSDLRDLPFVVLLGEPGIGKSTVLKSEAAKENAPVSTVRELMTGSAAAPGATLYLDALDEYRTDGGAEDKVHTLAHAIIRLDAPRWRLTCRSEDWRKAADLAPMSKASAGNRIVVAQLLPLDHEEAERILSALGEPEPAQFLKSAEAFGATGFIETPLGLKLLQRAVAGGGAWPETRFQLFAAATRNLAFERSAVRNVTPRRSIDQILAAASETFLVLLVSGARAIWRSNNEPSPADDDRAYVTSDDLSIDRDLLDDMLDTPLFRGEGEAFEPMHRTVAEFLAGRALAVAVRGSHSRAALSIDRTLALISGSDRAPPTELRGLFAWFAAHLAMDGNTTTALRLITDDAVTILSYGDAAVFETSARRALLTNLGRHDPYFRASEIGVTAVGGLAGEDLAEDFETILIDQIDATHRLHTVFEALTIGRPVVSLRPILRSVILDATRAEWQRTRAIGAYLNGEADPFRSRRELFDALAEESPSAAREAVRAALAASFALGALTLADVRSIIVDYRGCQSDNMMGRLYSLRRRLESEPMPELFDDPIASWLPQSNNGGRDHRIEIGQLLEHALTAAIHKTPDLSASSLWRWVTNVRRDAFSSLKHAAAAALADWLNKGPEREIALFKEFLDQDDMADGPWLVSNKYIATTHRQPSDSILSYLLAEAACATDPSQQERLLAIAVEIAIGSKNPEFYWATYDQIVLYGSEALFQRLTVSVVEQWRREDAERRAEADEEDEQQRIADVETLAPLLPDMRCGLYVHNLGLAAHLYFEGGGLPDVRRVIDRSDIETTNAMIAGWEYVAAHGLGEVDAAQLGLAEVESRGYHVEAAAIAGVDQIFEAGRAAELAETPIEVAIAVLKSSWMVNDEARRKRLEIWAVRRLNSDPMAGAAQLVDYWSASIEAGASNLPSVWQLQAEHLPGTALGIALSAVLASRPNMAPSTLRSAIRAFTKVVDKSRLADLARAGLGNTAVEGGARAVWALVAFVLDPGANAELAHEYIAQMFLDDTNSELVGALCQMADVDRLPTRAMTIRTLGPHAVPRDEWSRNGRVTEQRRQSEAIRVAIDALATDSHAGETLEQLANEPGLVAWHPSLRHALSQLNKLRRDQDFRHPKASAVRAALDCGPPVNASDLKAVVVAELHQLRSELRTSDTTPWKRYWSPGICKPLVENECRDHLLDRLRDRLAKYQIAGALPEARRGEETRADMLMLSGAGRNLPVEAKRHFHPDIWIAPATQLQGYTAAPGADGLGVYLVFWFGNDAAPTPARPDGKAGPTSGAELEAMLIEDLSPDLKGRTEIVVFDVSNPSASGLKRPRQKRSTDKRIAKTRRPSRGKPPN